jgi:hypothetical protein
MWKIGFIALSVSLFALCLPAFCEEEITIPRSFALGFSLGQRAGDLSASFNVTSPYIHIKISPNPRYWGAIRISGDSRIKSAIPAGGTIDSLMEYFAARIGCVGGSDVSNLIRMYCEFGGVSVFPTTELASTTNPHFGIYGYIGNEVFVGKNLFTKHTSIFMEIGYECGSADNRFDKLANRPFMVWGTTACAGGRFYL